MARNKAVTAPAGANLPGRKGSIFTYVYIAVFFLLTIAYLAESLLPKPDKQILTHYHLSQVGYHWLIDPLVTLLVIIWLVSLYGSIRVKSYSRLIKNTKDGEGFNLISNGLLVLTISLPLVSNISYILSHVAVRHSRLQPTMTIIINYIALGLMAIAMLYVFAGGHKLYCLISVRIRQLPQMAWMSVFILASSLYGYFIVSQPLHTPAARKVYFLPDWLLVLTIAVPYMFIWYLGVRGAYNIYLYRRNVKGRIYRSSLSYLGLGIGFVILGSIITRLISSISTTLTNLKLTPILLIIYGFLVVVGAGYILIAFGAKKLRNIEEA
jgi:hypothetical protein